MGGRAVADNRSTRQDAIVLVAEDDPANRRLLTILLERAGYVVLEAPDGRAALAVVAGVTPDLVLLDVQMPGLDGFEVTHRLRARPETAIVPIILLTGLGASSDRIAGLDAGASDFLSKPFDQGELLARVRAALRTKAAFDRLEDAQAVLVALANAVEAKDPSTEHHCNRLAGLALGMARLIGLDDDSAEIVGYGAALHDVGKIGIPEAILRKPGPLDEDEWVEMRRHSAIGASIVAPLRLGRVVAPIVRAHHERWDGAGYPDGLRGVAIPLGARIIAVADAFDAMTHDRPYRRGRTPEDALRELRRERERQFDPDLVDLFVREADHLGVGGAGPEELIRTRGLRLLVGAA